MKTRTLLLHVAVLSCCFLFPLSNTIAQGVTIPIETESHAILLQTDKNNLLRTVYVGTPLTHASEYAMAANVNRLDDENVGIANATYTPSGTWNILEPAIQVKHADGNPALELKYVSHTQEQTSDKATLTKIILKDPVYPFQVTLFYKVWKTENVIEQWTEIQHQEKKPVTLFKYASANLYLPAKTFYLTTFHGKWAKEMQPAETMLARGVRSIDSKLGTRAMLLQSPNFIVSFDQPASEN